MSTDLPPSGVALPSAGRVNGFPDRLMRYGVVVLTFLIPTLVLATGISWLLPDRYRASTTILPHVPFNPAANIAAQLGVAPFADNPLARNRLGGFIILDRFKVILGSRVLGEQVVRSLKLTENQDWILRSPLRPSYLGEPAVSSSQLSIEQALAYLNNQISVEATREGALVVEAGSSDPQWAARIANAYINQLDHLLNSSVLSAVKKARIFIEGQLQKAQMALAKAEEALRNFQSRHRTVALPEQTRAAVEASGRIAEQIAEVEVNLAVKTTYLTNKDKEIVQLQQRLAELKRQQKQLVSGSSAHSLRASGFQLPLEIVPSVGVELARLQRAVATQEKIYSLLTEQYELAKINESREDISFQVVDRAVPPKHPAGPYRSQIVVAAGMMAILLAILYLAVQDRWGYIGGQRLQTQVNEPLKQTTP